MALESFLLFALPVILTGVADLLIQASLRDQHAISWRLLTVSIIIVFGVCFELGALAGGGEL